MIRGSPFTMCVSFEKACMLSLVRAFARLCSVSLTCFARSCFSTLASSSSMSSREYHTARFGMVANCRIASR